MDFVDVEPGCGDWQGEVGDGEVGVGLGGEDLAHGHLRQVAGEVDWPVPSLGCWFGYGYCSGTSEACYSGAS